MKYIINESQYVHLLENLEKNKKFLTNIMGIDFTGKIKQVTSSYDVPMEFDDVIGPDGIRRYLNFWGPMYLFELDGMRFLYQDRDEFEWFLGEDGYDYVDNEITEKLNIDVMGLRFSDIINIFFNEEEDEVITEGKQNNVIDKLLKSFGITYNIKYGKRGLNELRQYDAVIITFYVDHGGWLEFTEMEPVYFFTKGNEIISEPLINRDFSRILNAFEYVPEELLKNYFSDKSKTFLENYLNERSN
jgi:hypothetical protein